MKLQKCSAAFAVHKAKRMANKAKYKLFIEDMLREFNITDPKKAFLLGAIDGMQYEMAASVGQAYMKPEIRKRVLRKIMEHIRL